MAEGDDAELTDLMHAVAHDLRNPLAAIMTNLEFARGLLDPEKMDPDLVDAVEDSTAACAVLQCIVSNLEVVLRRGRLMGSLNRVELQGLVRDVVSRCLARANHAGIDLELDAGDADERRVLVDRGLFALSLENLVANALQHAARGSRVMVQLAIVGEELHIAVRDHGKAIPSELRELALSPAGHTQRGRKQGSRYGRGLGLLAADTAAKAAGARVEIGGEGMLSVLTLAVPVV